MASSNAFGAVSLAGFSVRVASACRSWSLDLVPGPSEAKQSRQLQIKRPRVDANSQGGGTGQEVVAADSAGRKPKPKQRSKGGAAGGDSDHGLVSLVLSLEARLRAVEAATYSVVLVPTETSLPFKNMREAGKKYAQLVEAKGRREHDLGSPHLHVFLALLSALAAFVPPQGVDQAVMGRVEGVKMLLEQVIEHQTQTELGEWVKRLAAPRTDTTGLSRRNRVASYLPRKGRWKCRGARQTRRK